MLLSANSDYVMVLTTSSDDCRRQLLTTGKTVTPTSQAAEETLIRSLLQMCLHFTSGHHPPANSQLEHLNSMLEQYLRIYCNYEQDN